MWAQPRLLQTIVRYWDPEQGVFDLQGGILEFTDEYIYFITDLSHHGVAMSLIGSGRGGGALSVQYYVNTYCILGAQKLGTQVPIGKIASFPLKVIMNTIT